MPKFFVKKNELTPKSMKNKTTLPEAIEDVIVMASTGELKIYADAFLAEIKRRKSSAREKIEFIFNFVGGGYNTVWAESKIEAIEKAVAEYEKNGSIIDKRSFRPATKKELNSLYCMFD